MKPISLFGASIQSKSIVATAQRRVNCYYEITTDGDKNKTVIYGTPGLLLVSTFTYHIRAWRVVGTLMYVVDGPLVLSVNLSFVATALSGVVSNNNNNASMSNNATQLIIVDGIAGYTSTLPAGAVTAIVAPAFPNGATTVTYVGGYFVVEAPSTNQFWVSALNDGTTWPATFFQSAYSNPEYLVAVDSDHGVLILFGAVYLEYWYISGALDFPFSSVQSAAQQWGLAAKYSRAKIDNSIVFLAQNLQGQYQVMQLALLNSYAPKRVSTSDIEAIIANLSTPSDATALAYMTDGGHPMYQLTFQSAQRSFLLDLSTSIWSEAQTGVATTGRHVGDLSVTFGADTYMSDYNIPNMYKISSSSYTDNGTPIKRMLQSRHLGDMNIFSVDELFFDMETGVGLQSGQGSDPQIMLEVSKDGGRTFGNQRMSSIGMVGQYDAPRPLFRRVVNGRDCVIRLSYTDPTKFVVTREGAIVNQGYG